LDANGIGQNSSLLENVITLYSFTKGVKTGISSILFNVLDNQLDKVLNKEVNGDYQGSLYFQQYTNQVREYKEVDGILTLLTLIPIPEVSGASTLLGVIHNFEKRDGQIVSQNLAGFIKGAQLEIERIDSILKCSNDSEDQDFFYEQKDKLNFEITYNRNQFLNNFVFKDINGNVIDVDKNQYINNASPLPGIDYNDPIYKK